MTAKVGSLSSGPACEAGKLIVEVIGKDHPPGQRIVIYDETDNQQQEALTKRCKLEKLEDPSYSSTLHIWPWENEPTRHLWLEIETERGGPIRVPLMNEAKATPRQQDQQWNQITPIVPLTPMRGTTDEKDQGVPVLARPGYLYVFYRGKLWRELEIRQAAGGATTYHDIDVRAFRQQDGFCLGPRDACGKGLKEIWLPARWNRRQAGDVELAYAEIQLPAPRLARLEKDAKLRAQRCQRFDTLVSAQEFKRLGGGPDGRAMAQGLLAAILLNNASAMQPAAEAEARRRKLDSRLFPLSLAEPQRLRQPQYEMLFAHPAQYLHDLSGKYPDTCQRNARKLVDGYEAGQSPHLRTPPELDAVGLCLERALLPLRANTKPGGKSTGQTQPANSAQALAEKESVWRAQPTVSDVLADARTRQIAGLLVEDSLYRFRQLRNRIEAAQELVFLAAERASSHPHHASALLVSNFILPPKIENQPNPLSRYAKVLDSEGHRRIRHALAEPLKAHAELCHGKARNCLGVCLKSSLHQQALGDLFCMDGFDYLGAFAFTGQCMAAMTKRLNDPLNLSFRHRGGPLDKLVLEIAASDRHPLRAMLWPEAAEQACMAPYKPPQGTETNQGDGRFRPQALAALQKARLPKTDNLQLMESRVLAAAAERGDFKTLFSVEKVAAAILAVAGVYWGVLETAEQAVETMTGAQRAIGELQGEMAGNRERARRHQEELKPHARLAVLSLYQAQAFQQARAMLPEILGELQFIRSGRVNEKEHYVVRPELLDVDINERATRMSGNVLDAQGNPVATTNVGQARGAGMPEAKEDVLLAVLPKKSEIARKIAQLEGELLQLERRARQLAEQQGIRDEASRVPHAMNRSELRQGLYQTLKSPILPALLTMIEVMNVRAELASVSRTSRERSRGRANWGFVSASYDFVLALELLAERTAHNARMMQTLVKGLDHRLLKLPSSSGKLFVTHITGRIFAGAIGAGLFVGLSISDAIHEFAVGDDAGWGYALMATGGLVTFASAFMAGPAAGATLLAIGPAGWAIAIGLALTLAGAGLAWWLDDTPIEEWLAQGPFGKDEPSMLSLIGVGGKRPAHLQDPQEAFYRLVSLLAGIRVKTEPNPHHAPARQGLARPGEEVWHNAMRRSNVRIGIESNLPGLVGALGQSHLKVGTWLRLHVTESTPKSYRERVEYLRGQNFYLDTSQASSTQTYRSPPPSFVCQIATPAGLELYMAQPPAPAAQRVGPTHTQYRHSWAVRAQLVTAGQGRAWHFPAPPPTDPLSYDAARHASPDYKETGQDFWADEQIHKAESQPQGAQQRA